MPDYYVHVDSRFKYAGTTNADYVVTLPEAITNVTGVALTALEMPQTEPTMPFDATFIFVFTVKTDTAGVTTTTSFNFDVTIKKGYYTASSLALYIQAYWALAVSGISELQKLEWSYDPTFNTLRCSHSPGQTFSSGVISVTMTTPGSHLLGLDAGTFLVPFTAPSAMDTTWANRYLFMILDTPQTSYSHDKILTATTATVDPFVTYVHRRAFARIPMDVDTFGIKFMHTPLPGQEIFKWTAPPGFRPSLQTLHVRWYNTLGIPASLSAAYHSFMLRVTTDG